MKKMIKVMAPVLLVGSLSMGAQASETPNFLADCGIGGAIFKNDIGGVLSNIIWDFGLTATTSGLSSPDTCEGADVVAAEFIHQTYSTLAEETVVGEGAHMTALMDLYSCDASVQQNVAGQMRSDFGSALELDGYQASSDLEKSQQYFDIVKSAVSNCNA